MFNPADITPDRVRPLLRTEYDQLVAGGAFDDERVELLGGMLVTITPQDAGHAHTVQRLAERLFAALTGRAIVRVQAPLALLDDTEPEPDIAVVPLGNYSVRHPEQADLVVEVARSSLRRDRAVKGPLYARAGVPEYWLIDLRARAVEVFRDPAPSGFVTVTRHSPGDTLTPMRHPHVAVVVGDVLPNV